MVCGDRRKACISSGNRAGEVTRDLTEQDSADVWESLGTRSGSTLHEWKQADLCAGLWDMLGCAGYDIRFFTVTCDIASLGIRYRIRFSVYDIVVVHLRYRMHTISYVGPKISYFGHTTSYIRIYITISYMISYIYYILCQHYDIVVLNLQYHSTILHKISYKWKLYSASYTI